MLNKLIIKNIALIPFAEITFDKGLNVLSGETGSGKSVIIESLNFVLGAKADKSFIRTGEQECSVSAEFDVSDNAPVKAVFEETGLDADDILIITRRFDVNGKGNIRLNGSAVSSSMLKKFTSVLVDVFGQSEHFNLLNRANQLKLIDFFCGEPLTAVKDKSKIVFARYNDTVSQLEELGGDESRRLMRLDVLNYQIDEIEKSELKENEEEELKEIRAKIIYKEKIANALNTVKSCLSDEGAACDLLSGAARSLSSITTLSDSFAALYNRLDGVIADAEDVADTVSSLLNDDDGEVYDADYVENRLELIKKLKKKYGGSYEEIMDFLCKSKEEKDKLENFNVLAEKLLKEKSLCEHELYNLYKEMSTLRQKAAATFTADIIAQLKELGMNNAGFSVSFDGFPDENNCKYTSYSGVDEPEFLFTANKGEPLKPLSSIISGGELSRFMLAIKARSAKFNEVSTFIFDEIDTGISGNIARVVAEKFAKIAQEVQIIAITHLPQISAMADVNLLISKTEKDGRMLTEVKCLSSNDKIDEIIRLVGGSSDSSSARNHAVELIQNAEYFKKHILR